MDDFGEHDLLVFVELAEVVKPLAARPEPGQRLLALARRLASVCRRGRKIRHKPIRGVKGEELRSEEGVSGHVESSLRLITRLQWRTEVAR